MLHIAYCQYLDIDLICLFYGLWNAMEKNVVLTALYVYMATGSLD